MEQEKELAALRERLAFTELDGQKIMQEGISDSQNQENIPCIPERSEALSVLEEVSEEDTTLIAVDTETSDMSTSAVSSSADNESSPEMIRPQPESPVELKGASSDEMVTSTDSEVAHSSWTLLEAINQDAGQEWPQQIQDLNAFHLSTQSWEETSEEQVTSTCSMVKVESSSRVIKETVQVQISQEEANLLDADSSPSQAYAQVLAEELQKKYSELVSEFQQMKDLAAESQEKVHLLEENLKSLTVVKDEAEARALRYENDLMKARAETQREAEQKTSEKDKQNKFFQEQLESLQKDSQSKEQMIQLLQAARDEIQQKLFEKEAHAQMLGAQLEDRESVSSELEKIVTTMNARIQELSEETKRNKAAFLDKTTEFDDLKQSLFLKEQEMMELGDSMNAKLLQAGEEKFVISNEVKMLKEQMKELEKTWDDQQKVKVDKTSDESVDLVALRKENENLIAQIAIMKTDGEQIKRKLQAALVQRKELMKKIAGLEKDAKSCTEQERLGGDVTSEQRDLELQRLEAELQETRQILKCKEEDLTILKQKGLSQDHAVAEAHVKIQSLIEETKALKENEQIMQQVQEDNTKLHSQVTNMESDIDALQKKLQEAVDSRKDTLRKAKEKDRHHREQLRQQKEEYSGLLERFEAEDEDKAKLIKRVKELEHLVKSKELGNKEELVNVEEVSENLKKPGAGDWVQEDWVDFTTADAGISQQGSSAEQSPQSASGNHENMINSLQDLIKSEQAARVDLDIQLRESQTALSLKEMELLELSRELETLKAKEKQIDALSEELDALRKKCEQAEAHAEMLKAEVEEAAVVVKMSISDAESPVVALQAEVDEFKQFLKSKNEEIIDLSQQLSEQSFLLQKMQETVVEKDQLIYSLQEGLKDEQERSQKLEAEIPQKQEEEKDNSAKFQQLQRKFQAALVSRKEAIKENQTLKEELTSAEKLRSELITKITNIEANLSNLSAEKDKLIEEVDRTLLENQSLGATCESLKLAMDGLLNEKEMYKCQVESTREEAMQASRLWEEKVQGMKDEYETLLKSYENVSDEAERVRRVLEASRQERQESAARVRAYEAAKQEAEKAAEEAQKEVDVVKEKMRKFAKAKHQKIMELEEGNEKLREQVEKKGAKEQDTNLEQELEKSKNEFEVLKANFDSLEAERISLEQETEKLKQQLAQKMDKKSSGISGAGFSEEVKEHIVAQHLSPVLIENQEDLAHRRFSRDSNLLEQEVECKTERTESQRTETDEKLKENEALERALRLTESKLKELQAAFQDEERRRDEQESLLNSELSSLRQQLQESVEREEKLKEECSNKDIQFQVTHSKLEDTMGTRDDQEALLSSELSSLKQHLQESAEREMRLKEECSKNEKNLQEIRKSLEGEKDDLEERLMNQLAQVNGSIAGYQQEAADSRDRLADLQRELEKVQSEKDELEALLAGERDRAARFEEDKRQAQRERAEAEAEAGKQRELEQKLKSAQRVKEGSQSRARQLEELLREKQLEVRQMQKDCIQYQERISVLDRETKSLLLGKDEVSNELEAARQEMATIKEEKSRLKSELSMYKGKLDMAQGELSQALAENVASEQLLHRREAELKSEAERTLDEVRYRLGGELKQMELRLEQAYRDREREEEATLVAKNIADAAEKYAQETQARLDESLARLAAFSRSMSSLQDDRDRVLDEAKQWESRFHRALQGKETELREAESRAKDLSEQLQKETTQKEQLQSSLERFVQFI